MSEAGACLLIVGAGYSGAGIAQRAVEFGLLGASGGSGDEAPGDSDTKPLEVIGTRTSAAGVAELVRLGVNGMLLDASDITTSPEAHSMESVLSTELQAVLERMTHLVICVGPSRDAPLNDPVHRVLAPILERACPQWQWMAYLSTIGVYGDHQGQWIDESAPCVSTQERSIMRLQAEQAWQATASNRCVPASILRLSGIYGPGRNAVRDAVAGRSRRLVKKDQVFNRIHVDDIATATLTAARQSYDGVLNITDNEPAPSHVIVEFAHQLVGREPPPVIDYESAELSEMARSFYSENKRASNACSRDALGMTYRYPTYREGLTAEAERLGVAV